MSMIFSADDEARPTERLMAVGLAAVERARTLQLSELDLRQPGSLGLADLWPGEHYRLLAGLVAALDARSVVEIGSGSGLSALSMLSALPGDGRVVTFDLVPWRQYPGSVLRDDDFADGRLEQVIEDLSVRDIGRKRRDLLARADFIFVDAAKDGRQEQRFLELFEAVEFSRAPIVMFDDVRVWNMIKIWRSVSRPKLDLTSFGHWSGTGLIDYA